MHLNVSLNHKVKMTSSKGKVWMSLGLVGLLSLTNACGNAKKKPEKEASENQKGNQSGLGNGGEKQEVSQATVKVLPKSCSEVPLANCSNVLGCAKADGKCTDDNDLKSINCVAKSADKCQKASHCQYGDLLSKCYDIEGDAAGECHLKSYTELARKCAEKNANANECDGIKAGNTVFCEHSQREPEACLPNPAFGGTTLKDACGFLAKTGGVGNQVKANCDADLIALKVNATSVGNEIELANILDICSPVGGGAGAAAFDYCGGFKDNSALGDFNNDQNAANNAPLANYCSALFVNAYSNTSLKIARWQEPANHRLACELASAVRGNVAPASFEAARGFSLCSYQAPVEAICSVKASEVTRAKISALSETECKAQGAFLEWVVK